MNPTDRQESILRWLEMAQAALKAEAASASPGTETRFSLDWADGLLDATFESLKMGGIQ